MRYDGRPPTRYSPRRAGAARSPISRRAACAQWPLSRRGDVVALGRLPHRRAFSPPSAADRAAVEEALREAEVDGLACAVARRQLSGGERDARAARPRAGGRAEMLLADEPIASLDPLHQLERMTLLREASRARAAGCRRGAARSVAGGALLRPADRARQGPGGGGRPAGALTDAVLAEAYGVVALRGEQRRRAVRAALAGGGGERG